MEEGQEQLVSCSCPSFFHWPESRRAMAPERIVALRQSYTGALSSLNLVSVPRVSEKMTIIPRKKFW